MAKLGNDNPRWIGGKKTYKCPVCRKLFLRYEIHVLKRGKTVAYCSPQCYGLSRKGVISNEKHPFWKGDKAGYMAIHKWIGRHFDKLESCENCGTKAKRNYQWANISKTYKRDRSDWKRLCIPCHAHYDDYVNKAWETRRRANA